MAYPLLDNRFTSRLKAGPPPEDIDPVTEKWVAAHSLKSTKMPNRKSEAKKKWWAEKKAREAETGVK